MVCPSCTGREPSASFAASGVKTQAKVPLLPAARRRQSEDGMRRRRLET